MDCFVVEVDNNVEGACFNVQHKARRAAKRQKRMAQIPRRGNVCVIGFTGGWWESEKPDCYRTAELERWGKNVMANRAANLSYASKLRKPSDMREIVVCEPER
jgi:hypothetical protein